MDELSTLIDEMEYKVKPEERQKRADFLETYNLDVPEEKEEGKENG